MVRLSTREWNRSVENTCYAQILSKRYTDIDEKDTLSKAEFIAAWKAIKVRMKVNEASNVFNKYGQNSEERMPVLVTNQDSK